MKAFYGPYVWSSDQPAPAEWNWPLVWVVVGLTAFWTCVVVLLI